MQIPLDSGSNLPAVKPPPRLLIVTITSMYCFTILIDCNMLILMFLWNHIYFKIRFLWKFKNMICFCTIFVGAVYFIRSNAKSLEPMSPQLMHIILQHVNTLLTDVSEKVAAERKMLAKIDEENDKVTLIKENSKRNRILEKHEAVWNDKSFKVIDTIKNSRYPSDSDAKKPHLLKMLWKLPIEELSVPDAPQFEPDPFNETIFDVPATTAKPLDQTPEKQAMLSFMKTKDVNYFYGSAVGLFNMLKNASDDLLGDLMIGFETTISRMSKTNELKCLGYLLTLRLQKFAKTVQMLPTAVIKEYSESISHTLEMIDEDAMVPGMMEVILKYDSLFNEEEGNKLLDRVVMIHNYNRNVEDFAEYAAELNKGLIDAALAPVNRLCDSYKLTNLIADMIKVYGANFPNAAIRQLNLRNDVTPSGRSHIMFDKDSISQFIKVVHAFILTNQNLFMEFAKEHINGKEHQDARQKNHNNDNSNHKALT